MTKVLALLTLIVGSSLFLSGCQIDWAANKTQVNDLSVPTESEAKPPQADDLDSLQTELDNLTLDEVELE